MEYLRIHPYLGALMGAALLLGIGIYVVAGHATPAPTPSQPSAWQGNTLALQGGASYGTDATQPSPILQQVQSGAPYTYTLPNLPPASISTSTPDTGSGLPGTGTGASFDYSAAIALLTQKNSNASGQSQQTGTDVSAYSFIPGGLISTSTVRGTARSKTQQSLYQYGNDLGSSIQNFEAEHPGMISMLKDALADRNNTSKASSVAQLGNAYISLGDEIAAMDTVPGTASAAHAALAASYRGIGNGLVAISKAEQASDAEFVASIKAYDAAADLLTKQFVATSLLFGSYGVQFATGDPGSIFTFTNASL